MHQIENTSKLSAFTIPTSNGRVTLLPNQVRTFEPGQLGAGFLRAIQGENSILKLTNKSDEAASLATSAVKNRKKRSFSIVHGAGDISVEEALRRERLAQRKPMIRDDFTKAHQATQNGLGLAPGENPGPTPPEPQPAPPAPPAPAEEPSSDEETDGEDEGDGKLASQEPRRVDIQETHPAKALLDEAEGMTLRDLRTAAKEVLGVTYPQNVFSREDILAQLRKAAGV